MSGSYMNEPGSANLNTGAAHETGLYDPSKHDNQIVALYETRDQAEAAKAKLVAAGVDNSAVQVVDREADRMAGGVDYESGNQGLWGSIKSMFMPDEDAHAYNHALGAGHSMVVVTPTATMDRASIIHTLESTNPLDFDSKLEEWRQSGYNYTPAATATTATTTPAATTGAAAGGAVTAANLTGNEETLKVMEERLRIGKREVAGGAVRVRSYVVERPVEEQVRLHEEHVSVERRPVDRPATDADLNAAFQERTIEARATSEEAVVGKEARVVEEIGLRKEATERTETVRDTVRSTKVEVEDAAKVVPGATTTNTGTTGAGVTGTGTIGTSGTTTTSTPGATSSGMNTPRK
jgi:uncharacterized protein (TIGR02271 family)